MGNIFTVLGAAEGSGSRLVSDIVKVVPILPTLSFSLSSSGKEKQDDVLTLSHENINHFNNTSSGINRPATLCSPESI